MSLELGGDKTKKETFELSCNSSVLIYGAGALGRSIYYKIKEIYDIKGFIDRNVKEIKGLDIPVYDLYHISEYNKCVVIVCVHNGNWHYEIAEDLYACGFEKIIFLALADVYSKNEAFLMNRIYSLFFEEQYNDLYDIPYYKEIRMQKINEEKIIRENSNFIIVWCKKDLLYTYNKSLRDEDIATLNFKSYFDVPMIAQSMYADLFRFFMHGEGSADSYVNFMRNRNNSFEMSAEAFLREQYDVYQLLEKEYEKGIETWQYMPIDVRWNSRGYFNIIDGHHRCIFFWLKGMQSMPVRMSRDDYEIWMNRLCLDRVQQLLKKQGVYPAVRLNHPVLQEYMCRYKEYEITVLDILMDWLYRNEYDFYSVLEISNYQAYYGRNFYRMAKAQKITSVVDGVNDVEFTIAICALEYVSEGAITIRDSIEEVFSEEYTYELGLLCGVYGINELKDKIGYIDNYVEKVLFWQSQADIEEEKEFILSHSNFNSYLYLGSKCINGKCCEIGVYSK